jgi:hypothetical protein
VGLAWEAAPAVTGMDFGAEYAGVMVAEAETSGDIANIALAKVQAADVAHNYARPL